MKAGRILMSSLIALSMTGTMIADLGYMHASNSAWPPHARFHALWLVMYATVIHSMALGLLWLGGTRNQLFRIRLATLMFAGYLASFFVAWLLEPLFGAALTPDVPASQRPPDPLRIDGNLFSVLVATPAVFIAWRLCERDIERQQDAA